ncbi:MAG: glycosyltransferase family 4 protein [Armatimonadetes bacterium]|nr:glycosyltransferase family 4 protein [Armatimonadota bacterium]MCA1997061.1 glycosyltransferase family 4 protein [Armatimonadota bacterium]
MIACYGKNPRGAPLFRALRELDGRFEDLGVADGSRLALLAGALLSLHRSPRRIRLDARFSPPFLLSAGARGRRLVEGLPHPPSAILHWGATAVPKGAPYALVTDGPYDPDDPTYPEEWRPRRWSRFYLGLQRRAFRGAVRVFTLSEWARRKVLAVHGLAPERVVRIGWGPLGEPAPPTDAARRPLFVAVGSDWRRKGMDRVAEAARLLSERLPGAEVVGVGVPGDLDVPDGPGFRGVRSGLPPDEVQALIRDAAALLLPARFDASPHVIYEALRVGTPVVATPVCGVPEAVCAPEGGRIVPPDPEAIAQACLELWREGEHARRRALAVYQRSGGWRRCAEIVRDSLEDALAVPSVP